MTKKPNENDVVFIQALAELLSAQDLTEIEVNRHYGEDDSLNVRISKTQNVVQMAAPVAMAAPAAIAPVAAAAAPAATAIEDPASHPGAVISASRTGQPGLYHRGRQSCRGRHHIDHRSDEDHESNSSAAWRYRHTYLGRRQRRC